MGKIVIAVSGPRGAGVESHFARIRLGDTHPRHIIGIIKAATNPASTEEARYEIEYIEE